MAYTNATSLSGPGGQSNPFAQISNALLPIYSMFGPAKGGGGGGIFGGGGSIGGTGGGSGPFGLQPQPVSGGNDDLTRAQRSTMNLMGATGANLLQGGGNLINMGTGVTGGGLQLLQDPASYWSQLGAADPSRVAAAAGPYADIVSTQLNNALTTFNQGMPAGGAQAVFRAGAPQAAAQMVGNAELALQPQAMQQLAGLGGEVANIGLGMGGLGATLTGQGEQTLQNVAADILQKMGINIQGGTTATAGQWMNAIANLLGGNKWTAPTTG